MMQLGLNRWSLAFADLALLLTGYMVLSMSHANTDQQGGGQVSENGLDDVVEFYSSSLLFENEAMITARGRQQLSERVADHKAAKFTVSMIVGYDFSSTARLDEWELAAARTASIGRELENLGFSRNRIELMGPSFEPAQKSKVVISIS